MSSRLCLTAAVWDATPLAYLTATDSISALETAKTCPVAGIMENSFFVKEACNHEPGAVQYILNVVHTATRRAGPAERDLSFVFTQEWPVFTQAHPSS